MSVKSRIASGLLALLGVNLSECVSPDRAGTIAEAIIDEHHLNPIEFLDPVQAITDLSDKPDAVYVWTLSRDSTGEDMQRLGEQIYDALGREPRALHMFVRDVDELQKFDYHELEHEILPWLVQAKHRNGELQ